MAMIDFPVFSELEAKRDTINGKFHRQTKPQLLERLQQFGFQPLSDAYPDRLILREKSTGNAYILNFSPYAICVYFEHIRSAQKVKICEISNFALNAYTIMSILIRSIDSWLQYGVVYDYISAQKFEYGI